MSQAGVFGNFGDLGVLEDRNLAKMQEGLKNLTRNLCARLQYEASSYRSKSALSSLEIEKQNCMTRSLVQNRLKGRSSRQEVAGAPPRGR